MATHTLVLDVQNITGAPLDGAVVELSYDRTVRLSTGGLVPPIATQPIQITTGAESVEVLASDDPDLTEDSQGFGIRVKVLWSDRTGSHRSAAYMAQVHTADPDPVRLSDHLATIEGSGVTVLQGPRGPRGERGPAGVSSIDPSSFELRGTGSPVGTVTPPAPGVFYTDVEGTTGAWRWMATGTTASDWIVIIGDTGWRDITDLLQGGWTATRLLISRDQNRGYLRVDGLQSASGSSFTLRTSLPGGFEPDQTSNVQAALGTGTTPGAAHYWGFQGGGSGSYLRCSAASGVSGEWGALSYRCVAPWPTVLPGVPA